MGGASWHRRRVVETEGVYVELALGRWGNAIVVGVVLFSETENQKPKLKMSQKKCCWPIEIAIEIASRSDRMIRSHGAGKRRYYDK